MKKVLTLLLIILAQPAWAQLVPYAQNFGNICPGGSSFCQNPIPHKIVTFDFTHGSLPSAVAFSRASTAWYFNSSGNLVSAGVDTPRFDYGFPGSSTFVGLLIEGSGTNFVLNNRDLTQAQWIATNAAVALDRTGIDGVVNSASSITATSANATVCQVISHASASAVSSWYLKRVLGSGTISISQDGGATFSTVTLTSNWTRFSHSAQSINNPGICVKLATSGNVIGVDAVQIDYTSSGGSFISSPILTAGAAVTRSADSATVTPVPWYNTQAGSYVLQYQQQRFGTAVLSFASFNNSGYSVGTNNGNSQIAANNCFTPLIGPTTTAVNKIGGSYLAPAGMFACANNNQSKVISRAIPIPPTTLSFSHGWIQKFTYWNYNLTSLQLKAQTQ